MFATQLQRELDELLYRLHSGRATIEESTKNALLVCDGFTDSRMMIADVVTYAVCYLKQLPFPKARLFADTLTTVFTEREKG